MIFNLIVQHELGHGWHGDHSLPALTHYLNSPILCNDSVHNVAVFKLISSSVSLLSFAIDFLTSVNLVSRSFKSLHCCRHFNNRSIRKLTGKLESLPCDVFKPIALSEFEPSQ